MNFRHFVALPVLSIALILGACGGSARVTTPPGFAQLESGGEYTYRATTAQGVVVGTRVEPNEPHGNLDFWAEAIDMRLQREGYHLDVAKSVTATSGLLGKQLRYSRSENGRTVRYLMTVYTTDKRLYLVEAAGDASHFDPLLGSVEQASLTLRAN